MRAIEVARLVVKDGCHVFRNRKGSPGEYDAKPYFTGSRRGWVVLDRYTASAIVKVHDALNDNNREKFASFPIQMMATVAFKLVK